MDNFEEARSALIAAWQEPNTPLDEISGALERARLSIEDEIAEMDE